MNAIQRFKDEVAKQAQMTPEQKNILDTGSDHRFDCRCELCRQWWKLVGPDPEAERPYGPFSVAEVEESK